MDAIANRLRSKGRSKQLVVVIGDSLNTGEASLSSIAKTIVKKYKLSITPGSKLGIYKEWNNLVDIAEKSIDKQYLIEFVRELIDSSEVPEQLKRVACLPVSDFIDLTISRSLERALRFVGKTPATYAFWPQNMGMWRQRDIKSPSLFSCFDFASWGGIREHALLNPQNRIYIENLIEMVTDKDLLLMDVSAQEAKHMLHLDWLVSSTSKVVNTCSLHSNMEYWLQVGTIILNTPFEDLLDLLMPAFGDEYSELDMPFPAEKLVDITRLKRYDCFISYTHTDLDFSSRIERDLKLRGLKIWRDKTEIQIGDSFTDKIQEGLKNSYTFAIILSKEALSRPWVLEELKAAYNLRLAEELKIMPILYKDCDIPAFLGDYKYADFREEKRYSEQITLLERAITNAVKRARGKK